METHSLHSYIKNKYDFHCYENIWFYHTRYLKDLHPHIFFSRFLSLSRSPNEDRNMRGVLCLYIFFNENAMSEYFFYDIGYFNLCKSLYAGAKKKESFEYCDCFRRRMFALIYFLFYLCFTFTGLWEYIKKRNKKMKALKYTLYIDNCVINYIRHYMANYKPLNFGQNTSPQDNSLSMRYRRRSCNI